MNIMADRKTVGELQKLTDPRLLAYYKAERGRLLKSPLHKDFLERKDFEPVNTEYNQWLHYLNIIKFELNSRSHVDNTRKSTV